MIKRITVISHRGERLILDLFHPEKSGLVVTNIKGIGPGKATINTTEISTNDGSLYNSSRMSERNIVISLKYLWADTIEEVRYKTYRFFSLKKKITLIFETDTRISEIEGYVESNDPSLFSRDSGADISIICPDPYFYSAGEFGDNSTTFYGIEASFEFPFSNESLTEDLLEMGSIRANSEQVIPYHGDADVGVKITIHALGPAGDVTIYNTGTRERMSISSARLQAYTGSGIIAGDDIVISTVKGSKSITLNRAGRTANILSCLDRNSDWFQLAQGDNVFAYSCSFGTANLQFRVENRVVYEGI